MEEGRPRLHLPLREFALLPPHAALNLTPYCEVDDVRCFVSLRGLPVGFWSGGADNSREIELGLRRKRSPMAVGPMPSFACHTRASRFSSADMRGGCGGSFNGFGGMWPTPSGCAGVWEDPNVVKAAPTLEPVPLMHCTTLVKCNSHECMFSDVRF